MDDRLKAVLAALAVLVAVGLAVFSGIRSQSPPMHVVGHLGGSMQGGSTVSATNGASVASDNPDRKSTAP